jgi:hypothetical protein
MESFLGDELGVLASGFQPTVFVDIGSPYKFFGESNLGWYVLYSFRHFDADKQLVGESKESLDLGTSASGYMMYLTPVIFLGSRGDEASTRFRIGMGAGVGYVNASGDIVYTETDELERHDIDISNASYTFGILMEGMQHNVLIRVSAQIGMFNEGGLSYETPDISVDIGYVF